MEASGERHNDVGLQAPQQSASGGGALNYDMLFKWFLDMPVDARAFDPTTFTKNRDRLLDHTIADRFFAAVVAQAKLRRYVSSDHFSVDGTLLEAWASHKSFKPNDTPPDDSPPAGRNSEVDFHGQKRSNTTHTSTTDPEALMARKSNATAAKLCFMGHLLMEHRNGLIVDADLTAATGFAERDTAIEMLARLPKSARRRTVCGDKGYDTKDFVARTRALGFTPHVAQNMKNRRSRDRWAHDTSRRAWGECADPETDRGTVRMDENGCWWTQVALQGSTTKQGLVPDHRCRLQHHPHHRTRQRKRLTPNREPGANKTTKAKTESHEPASATRSINHFSASC